MCMRQMKKLNRLPEPVQIDRQWYQLATESRSGIFTEPSFYSEEFDFSRGKIIYPTDGASLSHQRAKLIKKNGKPHKSLWVRRLDLFLLTTEGKTERNFVINLAGLDRSAIITAQSIVAEDLPDGATIEGQTCWQQVYEIACDLLYTEDADTVFVSQFLEHLATGELEICAPIEGSEPLFTKERLQLSIRTRKWKPLTTAQRQFFRQAAMLEEVEDLRTLHLTQYGFIKQ